MFFRMLALSLFILSGCATIAVRVNARPEDSKEFSKLYPATSLDCGTIHDLYDYGWMWIGFPIVFDLPFSVISDTVCLPYDCFKGGKK